MSEFLEPQTDSPDVVTTEAPQIRGDAGATPRPLGSGDPTLPPLGTGPTAAPSAQDRNGARPRNPPSRADADPDWRRGLRSAPSSSYVPPTTGSRGRGGPPQSTSRADADPNWRRGLRSAPSSSYVPPTTGSRGRGQDRGRGHETRDEDGELRQWLKKQGDATSFLTDELWPNTREVLEWARERLGAPGITDLKVAASSGSCLTFLYPSADIVVQHFTPAGVAPPRRAFRAIQLMKEQRDPRLKNLAEIMEFDPDRRVIVVEKITSLNQRFDLLKEGNGRESPRDFLADSTEMDKLVADIAAAATALSEYLGVRQNDERLDNVGRKGDSYALYDYGMTNMSGLTPLEDAAGATTMIKGSISSMRQKHGVHQ